MLGATMSSSSSVSLLLLLCLALGPGVTVSQPVVASAPGQYGASEVQYPLCQRYTAGDGVVVKEEGDHVLPGGRMVQCADPRDYCFSYWTYVNNGTDQPQKQLKWLAQGCFSSSDACDQSKCVASRQNPANTFFCCCRGELCNEQVEVPPAMAAYTDAVVSALLGSTKSQGGSETDDGSSSFSTLHVATWILSVTVASVVILAAVAFAVVRFRQRQRKASLEKRDVAVTLASGEAGAQRDPAETLASMRLGLAATGWVEEYKKCTVNVDIKTVDLHEIIGKGRFGTVHRAMAGDLEVVVKVFTEMAKESYTNELFIYSHPFMHHPNLLYCLGSGSLGPEQWGLVLLHCSGGRLSDYLTHNTLTWQQLRRVTFTATSGLAHLHAPISAGGREKPSICHRDFNSRNLVLREDMSCVVIDLGLAVCVKGSSHSRPGRPTVTGTPPALNEAGSLRYMAPELLEGAVNLSECETALRQIDVYALGLVLWECYSRCPVISREEQPYQLPYQAEIGSYLTLNQMTECVVTEKKRPAFPAPADDVTGGVAQRLLRDTIEECWDADAEARLSTQCVKERLSQLPVYLRRYRGRSGGTDETGSEKDPQCINEIIQEDADDMFITENYLMQGIDDQEPPAYSERYDHTLFQNVGNYYSDGHYAASRGGFSRMNRNGSSSGGGNESQFSGKPSISDRSSSYGMSQWGEKRSLRTSEECSTRTLETLLSPSASGQPNMMLRTGCVVNQSNSSLASVGRDSRFTASRSLGYHSNEDGPLCSAVLQRGSAAPVSVLHSPSSPINSGETVPIIVPSGSSGRSHSQDGESAVSKLWSRFMRKMRRESAHTDAQKGEFYRNQPQVHGFQGEPLQTKRANCDRLTVDGDVDDASFKLLSGFNREREVEIPAETRFEVGEHGSQQSSASEGHQDKSQWCNTVPLRRHGLERKRPASRPVSLEIKGSPDECSSPLGTYLSTSLNFKTPEEVVLRKSKTRVKTPRHPPLPRLSLNGPINPVSNS